MNRLPSKKIGQRYGRLIVLCTEYKNKTTYYACICDCGNKKSISASNIISGTAKSCGCLQKQGVSKRSRKAPGFAAAHSIWNYYNRNASIRNLIWELSQDLFKKMILLPCYYCGHKGRSTTTTKYGDVLIHNGIDRLNNDMGYVEGNVVPCCKFCNFAKHEKTESEFKNYIKEIYENIFNQR